MEIQENVSLKERTWFETGGPARFYAEPETDADFGSALSFARERGIDVFVLGEGANVLISDDGFDGLVVKSRDAGIEVLSCADEDNCALVRAGAGASVHEVVDYALSRNLLGLEEFSGIPGTIGGAVYINIHYFEFLLARLLVGACVISRETLDVKDVSREWFDFGYDTSKLHEGAWYLLDATLKLRTATELETAYARGRRDEIIRHRKNRYPTSRTCGSFFQNFQPEEVNFEINGRKETHIAYYLDKLGVKGELRVGDAIVSPQHANMIVNRGAATSRDIAELAKRMQELVKKKYGLVPRPECRLVGFEESPLLE